MSALPRWSARRCPPARAAARSYSIKIPRIPAAAWR